MAWCRDGGLAHGLIELGRRSPTTAQLAPRGKTWAVARPSSSDAFASSSDATSLTLFLFCSSETGCLPPHNMFVRCRGHSSRVPPLTAPRSRHWPLPRHAGAPRWRQTLSKRIPNAFQTHSIRMKSRKSALQTHLTDIRIFTFRLSGRVAALPGRIGREISCGERFVFPRLVCAISLAAPVGCHTCRRLRQERARTPAVPGLER